MSTPPSTRTAAFAALLRELRRARGLTQEELAARAGISSRSLNYLERDDAAHAPRRDTLRLLIHALGLSDDEAARLRAAVPRPTRPAPKPAASSASSPRDRATPPVPLTPLVGREHEEAAAVHLLTRGSVRLLTLTGPAGVGKTRLALQVAATLRDAHDWTVRFVGLIPVHEADRVVPVIAQTLGIKESGAPSVAGALIAALRDQPLVLVLDNFEQVLPAAPTLADLLGACPQLKLLVTSRAPLNVRGEQVFPVPPLALADAHATPPVDQLERVAAVALFLERARAAVPDFALDPVRRGHQMAQVAAICRQVDGLPLAIELAAAQVRHFALEELSIQLGGAGALGILAGGPRDLPDHQRTMRSTIAWSYALLAPEEQRLCRVLSVFAGGVTLNAIQAIAQVDAEAALAGLSALVDKGLARRAEHPLGSRYDQLVVVRAYAREQLRAAGEEDEARRRHADFCLRLAHHIDVRATDQPEGAFARLETEHENIRAALAWDWETGATWHGLGMVGPLWIFWHVRGLYLEGLDWLERFIARAGDPATREEQDILAQVWKGINVCCCRLERFERAREAGEAALALRQALGDKADLAGAISNLANPYLALHDYERALALYHECLTMYRELNNRSGMIFPLLDIGVVQYELGRPREALVYYEQSIALSHEVGENEWARAITWNNIGEVYVILDDPQRAVEVTTEPHRIFTREHDTFGIASCALTLGRAAWRLGRIAAACAHLDEAERLFREMGNSVMAARVLYFRASLALDQGNTTSARRDLAQAIEDLAHQPHARDYLWRIVERIGSLACRQGHMERAAPLCAAGLANRDTLPTPVDPAERDLCVRDRDALSAGLAGEARATLTGAGQALTFDAALALARLELAAP